MKSMSEFARTLRDQAVKPQALDVEFARGAVAELRHCLDAMEAIHQKHMQTMNVEMQSKMHLPALLGRAGWMVVDAGFGGNI